MEDSIKKNANYFGLVSAGVMVVAVFMPWLEFSSSASFGGYSANFSSGGISGISTSGGIAGLLLALLGAFLAYRNFKWSIIIGSINLLNGIGYIFGWLHNIGSVNSSYDGVGGSGFVEAGVNPQLGLYVFTIAALLFVISTVKYLKKKEN